MAVVEKKDGRVEPFDADKLAASLVRCGIPPAQARRIAGRIGAPFVEHQQVSYARLREMVADELAREGLAAAAESYLRYKKELHGGRNNYHDVHDLFEGRVRDRGWSGAAAAASDRAATAAAVIGQQQRQQVAASGRAAPEGRR